MQKQPRLRRALVRGARADHWHRCGDFLVLLHPNGRDETEIPFDHLPDAVTMKEHYGRLADKDWVSRAALAELMEIADGARA